MTTNLVILSACDKHLGNHQSKVMTSDLVIDLVILSACDKHLGNHQNEARPPRKH